MSDQHDNPYAPPASEQRPPMPPRQKWGIRPVTHPRLRGAFGVFVGLTLLAINYAFIHFDGEFFPALNLIAFAILPICSLMIVAGQPFDEDGLPQRWYVGLFWTLLALGMIVGLVLTFAITDF